jgi:hypothetical protein
MPKNYKELPLSGSIVIDVPRKVLRLEKNDKVVLFDTLTKGGNVKGGKRKTVKLNPIEGSQTKIVSQGIIKPADPKSRQALAGKVESVVNRIERKVEDRRLGRPSASSSSSSSSGKKSTKKKVRINM